MLWPADRIENACGRTWEGVARPRAIIALMSIRIGGEKSCHLRPLALEFLFLRCVAGDAGGPRSDMGALMIVSVRNLDRPTGDLLDLEIVERKGFGHPDTICDEIAEQAEPEAVGLLSLRMWRSAAP